MKNLKTVIVMASVGAALVLGCGKFAARPENQYTKNGCSIADAKQPETADEYVKQENNISNEASISVSFLPATMR